MSARNIAIRSDLDIEQLNEVLKLDHCQTVIGYVYRL